MASDKNKNSYTGMDDTDPPRPEDEDEIGFPSDPFDPPDNQYDRSLPDYELPDESSPDPPDNQA
jgi:hypothetical protein